MKNENNRMSEDTKKGRLEAYLQNVRERNIDARSFWERNNKQYELMIKIITTLTSATLAATCVELSKSKGLYDHAAACCLCDQNGVNNHEQIFAAVAIIFLISSLALIFTEMIYSMKAHMDYANRLMSNEPGKAGEAPNNSVITILMILSVISFLLGLAFLCVSWF